MPKLRCVGNSEEYIDGTCDESRSVLRPGALRIICLPIMEIAPGDMVLCAGDEVRLNGTSEDYRSYVKRGGICKLLPITEVWDE